MGREWLAVEFELEEGQVSMGDEYGGSHVVQTKYGCFV